MKNLVIVESPTKARTLSQFLGKDYQITASMGHVRDLPRGEFGVDIAKGFEPQYVIPKEKIKAVNKLAKEAAGAEHLWLATDPDREGEAIAWNLLQVVIEKGTRPRPSRDEVGKVKKPEYSRVVFHEITKDAIQEAFKKPRKIDFDLVRAQQARRVLDRVVGYKLSPLLWKKIKGGLSAGRVQSVALRLIVDREREIEDFKSEEYWIIEAILAKDQDFTAVLVKIGDKKAQIKNKAKADKVTGDLENSLYKVIQVELKDARKYPNPPFTTSTLQQSCANRLGFVPKRTMQLAQNLYEEGLITYMRTDSVNLSPQAVEATRKYIEKEFGKNYLPSAPRIYKVKSKLAQEAHEAIRPTDIQVTSDKLQVTSQDHKKLYDLIWRRMVVCQMAEAVVAETTVDILAKVANSVDPNARGPVATGSERWNPESSKGSSSSDLGIQGSTLTKRQGTTLNSIKLPTYLLRANGQKVKFDGWYRVYEKLPINEQILPDVRTNDELSLKKLNPMQKFTEPPSRYTEATLIRDLEKNGIGRPSTYAPTISTLYERNYIEKMEAKKIAPTPVGKTTVDFLVEYFPDIVDLSFTREMEDDLDKIAQGKQTMVLIMENFWEPFEKKVEKVQENAEKMKVEVEVTDEKCEKCGKVMVVRYGRYGKFLACSGFPDCKNTKPLVVSSGLTCPDCGGNIVMKKTRRGKTFWGCDKWPECKFASWTRPSFAKASADAKAMADKPEGGSTKTTS